MSGETKKQAWEDEYEMEAEYDFSDAIPNPHAVRFRELNLVSLDADVKEAFPDSASVNAALRSLMKPAEKAPGSGIHAKAS